MAPTNPGLAELLASFEAAPDKVNWCLRFHYLGAPAINVMKDRVKNLDKKHDVLMEEKRRYEARFNGELDLMRSAARLPVVAKPRAGRRYARKESDYRGVCTTGGVQNPWAVRKQIPKEMREHEKDIYVEIGRFKTQQEAAIAWDEFMIADWRFSWAPDDPRLNTVKHANDFLGLCPEIRRAAEEVGRSSATRQRPPMRAPAPRGSFHFGPVRGALDSLSESDDDGAASDASRFVRDEDVRARGSFGYKD